MSEEEELPSKRTLSEMLRLKNELEGAMNGSDDEGNSSSSQTSSPEKLKEIRLLNKLHAMRSKVDRLSSSDDIKENNKMNSGCSKSMSSLKALPTDAEVISKIDLTTQHNAVVEIVRLLSAKNRTGDQTRDLDRYRDAVSFKQENRADTSKMNKVDDDEEGEQSRKSIVALKKKDDNAKMRVKKEVSSFLVVKKCCTCDKYASIYPINTSIPQQAYASMSGLFDATCPFSGNGPSSSNPKSADSYKSRNKHISARIYNLIHSESAFPSVSPEDMTGQYKTATNREKEEEEEESSEGEEEAAKSIGLLSLMLLKNNPHMTQSKVSEREALEKQSCILSGAGIFFTII